MIISVSKMPDIVTNKHTQPRRDTQKARGKKRYPPTDYLCLFNPINYFPLLASKKESVNPNEEDHFFHKPITKGENFTSCGSFVKESIRPSELDVHAAKCKGVMPPGPSRFGGNTYILDVSFLQGTE